MDITPIIIGVIALATLRTMYTILRNARRHRNRNATYDREMRELIAAGNAISTARRGKYAR